MGDFSNEGPLGIEGAAAWITSASDAVQDHLLTYTSTYTGRWFEWFAEQSRPERFTAEDVLAVASLSRDVRIEAAHELISDSDGTFAHLLAESNALVAAVGAPSGLADMDLDGELARTLAALYRAVRAVPHVGKVSGSKLLAAKFPAHVPIRDARVEQLLGLTLSDEWWSPVQELLRVDGVAEALAGVEIPADRPTVTTLRRLDIALWREAERRGLG
jgi:hypothetical protein